MLGALDTEGIRVAAYFFATAVAVVTWARERRHAKSNSSLWPTFWLLTAAIFLVMAIGRAVDLGDLVTRFGRDQAYAQGWYDNRRKIQAVVVAGVGALWAITVAVALWRVPARQRRYLPAAIAVFTLLCFVGVRTISLHQIDALMYHRDFAGAQIGTVGELTLLGLAVALTAWPPPLGTSAEYRRPAAVR
jgi:hypothetical protein